MSIAALVVAAGSGKRLGQTLSKPFVLLRDKPILYWTLRVFETCPLINEILLVVEAERIAQTQSEIISKYAFKKVQEIVVGGQERYHSVYNGLKALKDDIEWVAIHDCARPFLNKAILTNALEFAKKNGSAVLAVPVKDTIKEANEHMKVVLTCDRSRLFNIQTPQIFLRKEILKAYDQGLQRNHQMTDDAGMMELAGYSVCLFPGDEKNIKITTPLDLKLAELFLEA